MMLYINADDFGKDAVSDKQIISLIDKGIVNSVSLMANGENIDAAVSYLKSINKKIRVGIHFTLVDAFPLSCLTDIPSLVFDKMLYPDYRSFLMEYLFGRINMDHVYSELQRQIDFFIDKKIKLDHCDSHQHLHMLPAVADVVIDLCERHDISKVRVVNERFSLFGLGRFFPLVFLKYFSKKIRKKMRARNFSWDKFYGFKCSMNLNRRTIENAYRQGYNNNVELMCHPSVDNLILNSFAG